MPVTHLDATGGRGPSPAIFSTFNRQEVDYTDGIRWKTDFTDYSGLLTSTKGQFVSGGAAFQTYQSDTATVLLQSTINSVVTGGGILETKTAATDDHQTSIEFGDGISGVFVPRKTSGGRIGFEARFCVNQTTATLTTAAPGFVFGLGTPGKGIALNGQLTTGDALTTTNYGIFANVLTGAPTTLVANYLNANGNTACGTLQALVGYTFYKVGFLYTPSILNTVGPAGDLLQWFVNGVEVVAARKYGGGPDANFPTGLALVPMLGIFNTSANATLLDWDWLQCYCDPQTNG